MVCTSNKMDGPSWGNVLSHMSLSVLLSFPVALAHSGDPDSDVLKEVDSSASAPSILQLIYALKFSVLPWYSFNFHAYTVFCLFLFFLCVACLAEWACSLCVLLRVQRPLGYYGNWLKVTLETSFISEGQEQMAKNKILQMQSIS